MSKDNFSLRRIMIISLLYSGYFALLIYFTLFSFYVFLGAAILPFLLIKMISRNRQTFYNLSALSIVSVLALNIVYFSKISSDEAIVSLTIILCIIFLIKGMINNTKTHKRIKHEKNEKQEIVSEIDHNFNSFNGMIFVLSNDARIIKVNNNVNSFLEDSPERLDGLDFFDLFSQKAYPSLVKMLKTKEVQYDSQLYMFPDNGRPIPVEIISIAKTRDDKNTIVHVIARSEKLKQVKQEIIINSLLEKYFHLNQQMHVLIKRENYEIIDVNDELLSELNAYRENIIGSSFADYVNFNEEILKCMYTNQAFERELVSVADIEKKQLLLSGKPYSISGYVYYIIKAEINDNSVLSKSERNTLNDASLKAEDSNQLVEMIDYSREGFCTVQFPFMDNSDIDDEWIYKSFESSNITQFNKAIKYLFQVPTGKKITISMLMDNSLAQWKELIESVSKKQIYDVEHEIVTYNNNVKTVSAKYIPVFDGSILTGINVVIRDISMIKSLETDLNSSIQLFVRSIDSIADQVYVIDRRLNIKLANKSAFQFCNEGSAPDEIIGCNIFDILEITRDDEGIIQDVFEFGNSFWKEETLVYKFRKITVKKQYIPIIKKETVTKVIIIISEISKDKIARRAMMRIKAQQKALLDNIPHMAWLKDRNGVYISVNEPFAKLHGLTTNEIKGKTDFDLIPENLAIKYRNSDELAIKSREQRYIEEQVSMGNKTIWLEIIKTPIFNENNEVIGTTGLALDITERKISEEALIESEERFRQLTENIKEVFWLVDWSNNEVLYLSSAFESVFGMSEQNVYEKFYNWFDNVHPDDKDDVYNQYVTGASSGSFDIEYRIVKNDGEIRWIHNKAFPVCDSLGTVWRIAGVADDVTAWKQTQMELEKLNETLEMRVAERTRELELEISERIQVESALRESEGIFRGYFELGPLGMAITSPETHWLKVNKTLTDMFGYSEGELINSTWTEITHPDDYNDEMIHFLTLLEGQITGYHLEKRFIHKNGRIVNTMLFVRGVYDDENNIKSVLMLLQDITETKRTQEILDKKLIYEKGLAKCSQILLREDISPEQAINRTLDELLKSTKVDRVCIYENFDDAENGLSSRLVYEVSTPGTKAILQNIERSNISYNYISRWQDIMLQRQVIKGLVANLPANEMDYFKPRKVKSFLIIPLMVDGNWEGFVGFEDMTLEREWNRDEVDMLRTASDMIVAYIGRKKVENVLENERASLAKRVAERTKELSGANAQLAQAAKLKDEFLASMSHELRTPLNAILGLSEALVDQVYGPLNDDHKNTLRTIEESGRHLLDLINDILDLSKIDAGKFNLDFAHVGVYSLCESSVRFIKQDCIVKNIKISTEYDDSVETIKVDERRVKQILVNLLSNAVKFTPDNGSVSLKVVGDKDKQLVKFIVSDTGIGIAETEMVNLFKPFVQLDSSLSRRHGGTGLGLSLARKLVELHGGSIQVESTVGEGSVFTVLLPWDGGVNLLNSEESYESTQESIANDKKFLIYSDDEIVTEELIFYLSEYGITEIEFGDVSQEIVNQIDSSTKFLILYLDKTSEDINDILNEIHSSPTNQDINTLIISKEKIDSPQMKYGKSLNILMPITKEKIKDAFEELTKSTSEDHEPISFAGVKNMQATHQKTILLAEDNENNINMIYDYLTAKDFLVVVARNGVEAVNLIQENTPDLVLMDIQMPEMDGLEATEQIRQNQDYDDIPIIALTALAMPGDREKCLNSGANDYLTKPVSLKNLMNTINSYIEKEVNINEK